MSHKKNMQGSKKDSTQLIMFKNVYFQNISVHDSEFNLFYIKKFCNLFCKQFNNCIKQI